MAQKRYYYKSKDGKGYLNLKSPLFDDNYEEITLEEFEQATSVPTHEPTAEELARQEKVNRIAFLKGELARTDYEAIKYAEGWFTEEEYADIKAERQEWRDEINTLESQLGA